MSVLRPGPTPGASGARLGACGDQDLVALAHAPGRGGDDARAELTARYQPLVHARAARFARTGGRNRDDLVGAGQEGLLKAIRDFDVDRGVPFAAYASAKVHGEMMRWLRDTRYAVHVPRPLHERAMQVRRVMGDLETVLGRSPTVSEVAAELDTTGDEVLEAVAVASAERGRRAVLADAVAPTLDLEVLDVDLAAALSRLSGRERRIVHARYVDGLSQAEVGRLVGLSQPQVSRIERRAVDRLRELLVVPVGHASAG